MLFDDFKKRFAETKQKAASVNRAGSCGIVFMIIDDDIYVINVGDSRAVMGKNQGNECKALSRDHKPMEPGEFNRITANGGKIYQS